MEYNVVPELLQSNKVDESDAPIHNWYRFVLSYPPHIVRYYIDKFGLTSGQTLLDPFSGTGTTALEGKMNGLTGWGIEANPVAKFASVTKLNWSVDPDRLYDAAHRIALKLRVEFVDSGVNDEESQFNSIDQLRLKTLPPASMKLLLKDSTNPVSLHKSIRLIDLIKRTRLEVRSHLLLAAISTIVNDVSNLRFGPEVGVTRKKSDKPILIPWLKRVTAMRNDLYTYSSKVADKSRVILGDARDADTYFPSNSVNGIITSPPYPNEKDYSRTTRLENVLLGYVENMLEQRQVKKTFVRSNTRSVYKTDNDHLHVSHIQSIQKIAKEIEAKRIKLGKTSGFERLYHKVTLQYFGGMARHLKACQKLLVPGSKLAYIVGDQGSYLRVMIRTGHLLAEVAEDMGYKVEDIELFRTRFATASKKELREEALILTYNG